MKICFIGRSIILPHVRFLDSGHGKGGSKLMFHSIVVRVNGEYRTLGCDNMDDSGFCLGHEISREEFLEKYCNGVELETNRDPLEEYESRRNL
jgi:hypothetical protein